tara:strand:+ start:1893 stop:2261 length:369 start_codon:yes stop_codon:yes gene_type:complete
MKLKKLLEGFAWERKPGQPLPTLKDTARAYKLKEADGQYEPFDYDYFIGQIEAAQEAVTAVEEELIRTLDGLAEDEGVYGLVSSAAEQSANQARRYINGAEKQLEGLQKLLDRAKRQKSFDA